MFGLFACVAIVLLDIDGTVQAAMRWSYQGNVELLLGGNETLLFVFFNFYFPFKITFFDLNITDSGDDIVRIVREESRALRYVCV